MPPTCSRSAAIIEDLIGVLQDLIRALEHYSDLAKDDAATQTQTQAWLNSAKGLAALVKGAITREQRVFSAD